MKKMEHIELTKEQKDFLDLNIRMLKERRMNEMSALDFEDLKRHVGHRIECVTYGNPAVNVAVECVDCNEVLMDFDKYPEDDEDG
jgi:phosphopentomutase